PFAPHAADELWHDLGNETSVQRDSWPKWDDTLTVDDMITVAVQVNGKVRAEVSVSKDASNEDLEAAALAEPKIVGLLADNAPKRVIVVPGRLVNIVV
ncbi:TPA: leucine--tRNA ligase, partial [Candidatus Saccharibacteria bacterium]|nr:leucine--tRNA ligase [Candidatus Saccharibacteria bacterium]